MKARLNNVTPLALAYGDSEFIATSPFGPPQVHAASIITKGGYPHWQNTGPDEQARIRRGPISDIAPSWFILTWKQPQKISALWMADNFEQVNVEYFIGAESLNPRAATDAEWKNLRDLKTVGANGRMIELPEPLTTRAIRLNILKTREGPLAKLFGLHVFVDLKDQPVPTAASAGEDVAPPLRIPYTMDVDGKATIAIDAADGHRVRNLFARVDTTKGPHEAPWDLKDETGNTVAPGNYTWKMISAPPLGLRYQMTPYPNITENSPDNPPWHTSMSGPGGWLADHTAPRSGTTSGDFVFFGAPVSESGVSMATCDLTGKKLWAVPSFAGFTGSHLLAADDKTVFNMFFNSTVTDASHVDSIADRIWAVDIATHQVKEIAQLAATSIRKRAMQSAVAFQNKLYMSINAPENWLATSASPADVDIENCYPRLAATRQPKYMLEDVPDARGDWMGMFHLTPIPPRSTALKFIESTAGKSPRHHVVLAFRKPTAIGTIILPRPEDESAHMRLSFLKPDAPYPPNAGTPAQWEQFAIQPKTSWDVAVAPKYCVTRALRVTFSRGEDDSFTEPDESLEYGSLKAIGDKPELKAAPKDDDIGLDNVNWTGRLEGLKIVGRRFENIAPAATVRLSSGAVDKAGIWDAKRTTPLTDEDPGIYALEWKEPQSLRGLAIKEIDGKRTEIDVYTGADSGPIDIRAEKNWKHADTYIQKRRIGTMNQSNEQARYLDGYIEFDKEIKTRGIRLRVCEQWADRGREELFRWDVPRDKFDPARCRIFGVAAMKYVGGESAGVSDPLAYQRIEVLDGSTGKIVKETAIAKPGPLAMNAAGDLFSTSGADLVKVDLATGNHQTIVAGDLIEPQAMALDKAGNFYIYDHAPDRRTIRVYSPAGKLLRSIGTPGGYVVGAWDPTRLHDITALVIDKNEHLWAVDQTYYPKRISEWTLDGKWQKDFWGNTSYGGGGVLDPNDKRRLFYNNMEFELNWETGHSHMKNITWLGDIPPGEVPIPVNGRTYMVTRMMSNDSNQQCGHVYLYDKDHLKPVAAMGRADAFPPLSKPAILAATGGKNLVEQNFIWSDLNGDGEVQANEVTLFPRKKEDSGGMGLTNFNTDLGVQFSIWRFQVKNFLPNGVPVYEVKEFPKLHGLTPFRLDNGNFHTIGDHSPEIVMDPEGKHIWTYPAEGMTTQGYADAKPYSPGQVVSQFSVAGHGSTHAGDLGEFLVMHTNMGVWNLWTADGLLAATIFNDQRLPGMRSWLMPEHERGMNMDDVTIGQEHFQAYFCRTADNRYYAVAGHNHVSVVEVLGMEKFKRATGKLEVTGELIAKTAAWDASREKEQVYTRAPVLDCYHVTTPPKIDGSTSDWDAESPAADFGRDTKGKMAHGGTLRTAFDAKNLYLCYEIQGLGPIKNTGEQWDRLFKTGAAVDLQIGTDPTANAARTAPVAGDKRLLMTFTGPTHTPTAVLYEAVVPGTSPDATWKAVSPIGQVSFDRVRKLETVGLAFSGDADHYVVEAAIPLEDLGLKPADNVRVKLDWGVLVTDAAGNGVMRRVYWSNQATAIVADVPSEAKLQPDLWGFALFHDRTRKGFTDTSAETRLKTGGKDDPKTDKLLKEFESELEDDKKGKK